MESDAYLRFFGILVRDLCKAAPEPFCYSGDAEAERHSGGVILRKSCQPGIRRRADDVIHSLVAVFTPPGSPHDLFGRPSCRA